MKITDEKIDDLWHEAKNGANVTASTRRRFARAIIAALERDAALPVVPAPGLLVRAARLATVWLRPDELVNLADTLDFYRTGQGKMHMREEAAGFQAANLLRNLAAALAAPSQPGNAPIAPCQMCGGHGLVGGYSQDGSHDDRPCPDCAIAQQENSNG